LLAEIVIDLQDSKHQNEEAALSETGNVFRELSEKISTEIFYNGLWQLLHLGIVILVLAIAMFGQFWLNSFFVNVFSWFSGLLIIGNLFQFFFYQSRRYTLRQFLQEVLCKRYFFESNCMSLLLDK